MYYCLFEFQWNDATIFSLIIPPFLLSHTRNNNTNQHQNLLSVAQITEFPFSVLYRKEIDAKIKKLLDDPRFV